MKELKYLKLFEAFESEKLTKTLGYIEQKSKNVVLDSLRRICKSIDFPFSQLKDEYFKYLPYQKALNLQYVGESKPCQITSKSAFSSHGIEGETCQDGKIKRMWGSRQRVVECPNCGGTGIQPEKQEIKLLKFWFTKEGEMVTMTGVDNMSKPTYKTYTKFSLKTNDYKVVGDLIERRGDVRSLKHGDMVISQLQSGSEPIICYVWKHGRYYYLLQNSFDGDSPDGRAWKDIASLSWNITDGDFITLRKVELKDTETQEDDEPEIDPFSFNKPISFNYRGLNFENYFNRKDIEKKLSNSHFALVFDISSFKESNFKTKSEIEGERKELKSGSVLTVKDSDIKKANINRYMQEIAKRSDIVSDISNLPKVIKRLVGGENILFFMLYNSRFTNSLDSLADYYVSALTNDSYKEKLSEFISSKYKSISETNLYTSNNIKSLKLYCQQKELEGEYKIIDGLERLSKKLYEKISVMKFECVEDIDILKAKLDSIRQVFRNSRYYLSYLDYVMDSISSKNFENPKKYLTEHYYVRDSKTQIIQGIEQCLKVLDRY